MTNISLSSFEQFLQTNLDTFNKADKHDDKYIDLCSALIIKIAQLPYEEYKKLFKSKTLLQFIARHTEDANGKPDHHQQERIFQIVEFLNNENEQIGLQLWQYLSGCVGGIINTPVNRAELITFQTGNYYTEEQVMHALRWCIDQEYFTKVTDKDGGVSTMLIKAYQ